MPVRSRFPRRDNLGGRSLNFLQLFSSWQSRSKLRFAHSTYRKGSRERSLRRASVFLRASAAGGYGSRISDELQPLSATTSPEILFPLVSALIFCGCGGRPLAEPQKMRNLRLRTLINLLRLRFRVRTQPIRPKSSTTYLASNCVRTEKTTAKRDFLDITKNSAIFVPIGK